MTFHFLLTCVAIPALMISTIHAAPAEVVVTANESSPGAVIPADFLGLSYEKNVLALDHFRPDNAAMLNLMRNLGTGVLRFGANDVETTRWNPDGPKSFSREKSVIGTRELENAYHFASASGWSVIHGLNLGANDPQMAAREAAAALRIGGASLIAFEIGNEPEHYGKTWRSANYDYAAFHDEISAYLKAMRLTVPRIPLAGPATTSTFPWFEGFIRDFRSDLVMTTRHNYPLAAATTDPANPRYATIENLLSPATAEGWRKLIGQHQQASKAAGLPFRMGEGGSASSGGKPGVSDVFASALWTADYLFDLAELGVAGVNFHSSFNCRGYTPFCALKGGGYHAHPGYYGMLFFRQAAQGRVLPVDIHSGGVNLTSHAVLGADGVLRVALINKDLEKPASVVLSLAGRADEARILRLTAPSVGAREGVVLGGSAVAGDGTWSPAHQESIRTTGGKFQIQVPAASAALVAVGRKGDPAVSFVSKP